MAFLTAACLLDAQGVAVGNVTAHSRPKFSGLPFPVRFEDVAAASGIVMRFVQGQPGRRKYIVEANGTGVAFVDFDNDGFSDVFLVNGSRFTPFPKGAEPISRLYRNDGKGRFRDVTLEAGVGRHGWGNGVCRGDFDNDGNEDLYVTYWGVNSLYRNLGSGKFQDVARAAGVAGPDEEWSTGCTFLDFDRDGLLDLFVASYVGFSLKTTPPPGANATCMFRDTPVFCGPRGLPHGRMTLFRNLGDGRFRDISVEAGVRGGAPCYGFTAAAADFNGDLWADIYVACDSTASLYFRNEGNGRFREIGVETGVAYNEHGTEQAGMGLAIADYDNDGWLDISKTNFIRDYPNLFRNLGKGIFEDRAVASGLGVNPHYVLWGVGLEDFDNDGFRDLLQVGGHVYPELEKQHPTESFANPRILYRNLGGTRFEDVSSLAGPGIAARHASHGAAFADYDNNGSIDALIMNQNEPPSLLRNHYTGTNGWLQVRAQGTKSNRDAIGASVTIEAAGWKQTAAILSQSSYLSANDLRLHFGLGTAKQVDRIVVRWPSGLSEEFPGVLANRLVLLVEGKGK